MASDARFAIARRAPVDGNEFAERIIIADLEISRLALIFQILRLLPDRRERVEFISCARLHRSAKRDMMLQPTIFTEDDALADEAIRSDDTSRSDLGAKIDNRCGMNLHVTHDSNDE
jgi:hypothetical protein